MPIVDQFWEPKSAGNGPKTGSKTKAILSRRRWGSASRISGLASRIRSPASRILARLRGYGARLRGFGAEPPKPNHERANNFVKHKGKPRFRLSSTWGGMKTRAKRHFQGFPLAFSCFPRSGQGGVQQGGGQGGGLPPSPHREFITNDQGSTDFQYQN